MKTQKTEIRLSGSGGQGLITAGIILARASIVDGYRVTQTQSYGPESRGGSSRADVIIAKSDVHYPEATHFDILLALTQESCDRYSYDLKEDGILIIDNTYVKNVSILSPNIYEMPFTELTIAELKTPLPTNIVTLSFLVKLTKCVSQKALEAALAESMKPAYLELNKKAMKLGFKLADEYAAKVKEAPADDK